MQQLTQPRYRDRTLRFQQRAATLMDAESRSIMPELRFKRLVRALFYRLVSRTGFFHSHAQIFHFGNPAVRSLRLRTTMP